MDTFPFSLNIFRQLEIFQEIKRLDGQFNSMLTGWKDGEYKKSGAADNLNINYPTWEIEKKLLIWMAKKHKHLGSPVATKHLNEKNLEFLKDVRVSQTEIAFASSENVLKNLVVRGYGTWEKGVIISQQGSICASIIDSLYKIKKDNSFKKGETRYREEKLIRKKASFFGYELIYWASLLLILLSLVFFGISFYKVLNFGFGFPFWIAVVKYFLSVAAFLPAFMFLLGLIFIKIKK